MKIEAIFTILSKHNLLLIILCTYHNIDEAKFQTCIKTTTYSSHQIFLGFAALGAFDKKYINSESVKV